MTTGRFTATYIDHVLNGAKKAKSDATILGNLRRKIENVLRNFHRNADHPESDYLETQLAIDAVLRAVQEAEAEERDMAAVEAERAADAREG